MYATHQPIIAEYGWRTAQGMFDVCLFARLTVRRHLYSVKPLMDQVRVHGARAIPDRQSERAYQAIASASVSVQGRQKYYQGHPRQLFYEVLSWPGFGMVKAGFVCQMLLGYGGCLDIHNIRRFGLDAEAFRSSQSIVTMGRRVNQYLVLCKRLGGPQVLWDDWCTLVAILYPESYVDAEQVSAEHLRAILPSNEWCPF